MAENKIINPKTGKLIMRYGYVHKKLLQEEQEKKREERLKEKEEQKIKDEEQKYKDNFEAGILLQDIETFDCSNNRLIMETLIKILARVEDRLAFIEDKIENFDAILNSSEEED